VLKIRVAQMSDSVEDLRNRGGGSLWQNRWIRVPLLQSGFRVRANGFGTRIGKRSHNNEEEREISEVEKDRH